jgi:hypothetical protein
LLWRAWATYVEFRNASTYVYSGIRGPSGQQVEVEQGVRPVERTVDRSPTNAIALFEHACAKCGAHQRIAIRISERAVNVAGKHVYFRLPSRSGRFEVVRRDICANLISVTHRSPPL